MDLSSLSAKGFVHYWGGENGGDLYFLAQKAGAGEDATKKIAKFKAIYRARLFSVISRQIDRVVHDPLLCLLYTSQNTENVDAQAVDSSCQV